MFTSPKNDEKELTDDKWNVNIFKKIIPQEVSNLNLRTPELELKNRLSP